MKVAILGAGLSGLACALILEQHGIIPAIFDDRRCVGDRFVNGEILLPILERFSKDPLAHLSEHYGIYLQPLNNITALTLHSEKKQAQFQGQLGFINSRGRVYTSFENQLARQLKTKIIFNTKYAYKDLLKDFTHVILAVGDYSYTEEIQGIKSDFSVTLKGATVSGSFKEREVAAWLDNNLAPKGYCYLIPFSNKEANITLAYPEYSETKSKSLEELWSRFYERVCLDTCQDLRITDRFEIIGYKVGICDKPRIGNTFFVGNCFGSIMPALGFGQIPAILTGIYAALDLLAKENYAVMANSLYESYKNSLVIRRALEQAQNSDFDTFVNFLGTRLGNRLFNNPHFNTLKLISRVLKLPLNFRSP